jgi:3',5'-cyclic AMP phosphodiesterase CpdA
MDDKAKSVSTNMITTRRRFLRQVATTGSALLVLRPAALQSASLPPLSFVIITDTHLGKGDSDSPERLWAKTAAEVQSAPGAFVLHLGDIVDGERETQYAKYLEVRKAITRPVYEIPGNHDKPEDFQKHIRKDIDTFFDHDWLRIVLMNNSHTNSHEGFFTTEQLAWLARVCNEAASKNLRMLICTHVPLHHNTHPDRGWYVKPANGQLAFYELLQKHAPRVLALFHGHFHNGLRGWDNHKPVHEVLFPSALYNQDRKLEQQNAPGYNPPEFRPGYTLVSIDNGTLTLRYRVTGADGGVEKTLPVAQA